MLGVREALTQPQAVAREMAVNFDHAMLGPIPIVNRLIRHVDAPQPPPVLGQHTDEILRDVLALDDAAVERLRPAGAVA